MWPILNKHPILVKKLGLMVNRFLLFCVFLSLSICGFCQSASLDLLSDRARVRINNSGSLFWNLIGSASYKINADGNTSPIFMSTLWIGGLHNNVEYSAAQTYRQGGRTEFVPGPVTDTADVRTYDRIWPITRESIDQHIELYQNDNYTPPKDIVDWPAHGRTEHAESNILAPFVDIDENGIYEPEKGDYPKFEGDYALYFILSEAGEKKFSNTAKGDFEIHCMAYAYSHVKGEPVASTVFLSYKIFNRSDREYEDFYIGQFNDFELGSHRDDLVGCDTNLNLTYVYNGDDFDDGAFGYGSFPPGFGCTFLNKEMTTHQTFDETISSIDLGADAYNYLSGKKITSEKLRYPGDPVSGTGSLDSSPNDRTTLSTFGPFDFKAGSSICFNMAFIYARDKEGEVGHKDIIGKLRENVIEVRDFYKDNQGECFDQYSSVQRKDIIEKPSLVTGHGNINITGLRAHSTIAMYDLNGRVVFRQEQKETSAVISTSDLNSGVYLIRIESSEGSFAQKVALPRH